MFYIKPKRAYCRKHGIEYSGYMCPECRMEIEHAEKVKQDEKLQKLLGNILNPEEQEPAEEETSASQPETIPEIKSEPETHKPKEIHIEDFPIRNESLEETNQARKNNPKPKSKKRELNKAVSISAEEQESSNLSIPPKVTKSSNLPASPIRIPNWLFTLLLIFALSVLGLGLNALARSSIPLWLLLGFSIIYPIEKWFRKTTLNKPIGKLYRLILNLVLLAALSLLIWSGYQLVTKQLASTPLISSVVFLAEIAFFIWIWRKVSKNSWRWPSMKLTIVLLVCIAIIFTFAGVPPLSIYKDNLVTKWREYQVEQATLQAEQEAIIVAEQQREQAEQERAEAARLKAEQEAEAERAEIARQEELIAEQARKEAEEEAARIASLRNPSWKELKAFLLKDDTDKLPYIYPAFVCADFANRVRENAQEAGWRCAVVSMRLTGYDDPFNFGIPSDSGHAVNAFETTDRGLVYIDSTGWVDGVGPIPADRLAVLEIGKRQRNTFIFPSDGWENKDNVSIIRSIDIRW